MSERTPGFAVRPVREALREKGLADHNGLDGLAFMERLGAKIHADGSEVERAEYDDWITGMIFAAQVADFLQRPEIIYVYNSAGSIRLMSFSFRSYSNIANM